MGDFFEGDSSKYGLDVREMDAEHQKLIALRCGSRRTSAAST